MIVVVKPTTRNAPRIANDLNLRYSGYSATSVGGVIACAQIHYDTRYKCIIALKCMIQVSQYRSRYDGRLDILILVAYGLSLFRFLDEGIVI